jgi:4-hydroxy-tetrahydrodipicolinate synthase
MFEGTYTALVTPFVQDRLDEPAFVQLIEAQISGGVTGIVPVGTTGESPTLDYDEHHRVIELAVQTAKGRCQVIAGTGSNSTKEAVDLTREAERLGADGALIVAPYYNRPTQAGLVAHYSAIADATKLPIMLYSIPGRCGVEIAVETVATLAAKHSNIVAIKEAGGSVERVSQLRAALPAAFEVLSGDDSLTLPFLSVGAVGVVSVASNIIPKEVSDLVRSALAGDYAGARTQHFQLYTLFKELFVESNPAPTKYALSLLGRMHPEVRLPLAPLTESSRARVEAALRHTGILPAR